MACFSRREEFVIVSGYRRKLFGKQQAKFTAAGFLVNIFSLFHVIWTLLPGWKFTCRRFLTSYHRQAKNIVQSDSDLEDGPKMQRLGSNLLSWLCCPKEPRIGGFISFSFCRRRKFEIRSWHMFLLICVPGVLILP